MSALEIVGRVETVDLLDSIGARGADLMPLWPVIHQSFLDGEKRRFDDEGPGWAPLAPSTVARKGFATILVETGALKASLTEDKAPGAVYREMPDGLEMGTDYRSPRQGGRWASVALASFHQFGTRRMPARPVIDAFDPYVATWAPLLADYLTAGVVPEGVVA